MSAKLWLTKCSEMHEKDKKSMYKISFSKVYYKVDKVLQIATGTLLQIGHGVIIITAKLATSFVTI